MRTLIDHIVTVAVVIYYALRGLFLKTKYN